VRGGLARGNELSPLRKGGECKDLRSKSAHTTTRIKKGSSPTAVQSKTGLQRNEITGRGEKGKGGTTGKNKNFTPSILPILKEKIKPEGEHSHQTTLTRAVGHKKK